jgi:hypothetical protein
MGFTSKLWEKRMYACIPILYYIVHVLSLRVWVYHSPTVLSHPPSAYTDI